MHCYGVCANLLQNSRFVLALKFSSPFKSLFSGIRGNIGCTCFLTCGAFRFGTVNFWARPTLVQWPVWGFPCCHRKFLGTRRSYNVRYNDQCGAFRVVTVNVWARNTRTMHGDYWLVWGELDLKTKIIDNPSRGLLRIVLMLFYLRNCILTTRWGM